MSHWRDYHMLLVINYFVLTILITRKLVRGSGAVTEVPGGWSNLRRLYEESYNSYLLYCYGNEIKKNCGGVEGADVMTNVYRILAGRTEGKGPLERPKHRVRTEYIWLETMTSYGIL
jgi:hypothetical protein